MNKLWLIFKREYLVRVKKRSFILVTLLTPLALAAIIAVPIIVAMNSEEESKTIALKDDSGILADEMASESNVQLELVNTSLEELKRTYKASGYDGVLYIPAFENLDEELAVQYFSSSQLTLSTQSFLERRIEDVVRNYKIENSGYDKETLAKLEADVNLEQMEISVNEAGELEEVDKKNSAAVATALGYLVGFFIYFVLIFYGAMVMRSVMEEKMSRIVEVIIISVKPFQLMLGKILGVSGVAFTQVLIWIILIPTLTAAVQFFLGVDPAQATAGIDAEQVAQSTSAVEDILGTLQQQNWPLILPLFIIYFLGGYFIYASLFAAVGAAVGDDLGESQSLTFPIMLPIILAFLFMTSVIDNPNSGLAFWTSMIPLFSPIIMPARIPFGVPAWEIIVSVVLLIATAIFFIWLSGRIYRVGILLYGKKASLKELGKWLFYKE